MKAVTHYLFSAGVSLALLSLSGSPDAGRIVFALWLALSINYLIDAMGHASRGGGPTRTWLTHSVLTAPAWGAAVSLASLTALAQASAAALRLTTVLYWTLFAALVSGEHLFLDSLTQAGVYSWRRRIAIAHFRYDDVPLNLGFALVGALLIAAALGR